MWIWNQNESVTYPGYCMKTCTIQYSLTGSTTSEADWTTIFAGDIPQTVFDANGYSTVSLQLPFNGAMAKYVVVTAAVAPDHSYNAGLGITANQTGLAEVRFYPQGVQLFDLSGIAQIAGFAGNVDLAPITVELIKAGTTMLSKTLKNGDTFSFPQMLAGSYQLRLSAATCLAKAVDVVLDANKDLGAVVIPGGDGNGDGSVGLLDLAILKQGWGQHS
jgi:hypothetical protein